MSTVIPNHIEYFEANGRIITFVGADEHFLGVDDEDENDTEWCGIHDVAHRPGGFACEVYAAETWGGTE